MKSDIGRYAIIPEWLLDAGVSSTAIRLFATLAAKFADRDSDEATPSRATLASALGGCSTDTIDRATRELIAIGAIAVEQRFIGSEPTSNRYMLFFAAPETSADLRPPSRMDAGTGSRMDAGTGSRMDAALTRINTNQNHLNQAAAAARPGSRTMSAAEVDVAVGELCRDWEAATGTTVTQRLGAGFEAWLEKLPQEAISKAIAETGVNGARTWRYTETILSRYLRDGWADKPKGPKPEVFVFDNDRPLQGPEGMSLPAVARAT